MIGFENALNFSIASFLKRHANFSLSHFNSSRKLFTAKRRARKANILQTFLFSHSFKKPNLNFSLKKYFKRIFTRITIWIEVSEMTENVFQSKREFHLCRKRQCAWKLSHCDLARKVFYSHSLCWTIHALEVGIMIRGKHARFTDLFFVPEKFLSYSRDFD